MAKTRTETWLALLVIAAGLLLAAIPGMWVYMSATATPLHPDPQDVSSVAAAPPAPDWADAVEQARQTVRSHLSAQNLPGLSVAVGAGGRIVWAEGFGWADLEKRTPVAPDTPFRIGTVSTVLTSAAVGLLLERGRLNLDDAIQMDVPEFPEKQWPVTLRQLMGHLAGITTDSGDEGPLFTAHCQRPIDALPFFAEQPLRFEPGTEYRYSNYGWILVSAAVEAAAGAPFLTFMQKQIFGPLGMNQTRADVSAEPVANRATAYFPRFASDPRYGLHLMRPIDYSCYAGGSVFQSTPSDLVRFAMAITAGTLLQPATVQLLQTSQRLASGSETGYGLGWDLETATLAGAQTHVIGHEGESLGGMMASLLTFPDYGIVVSVTSNISYTDTHALAVSIAQAFAQVGRRSAGR